MDSSERVIHGSVAPQVLGFVGIDNQGLEGLELYYDKILRGTPGHSIRARRGRPGHSRRHSRVRPRQARC